MARLVFDSVLPQLQQPFEGPYGHCGQTPAAPVQSQWTNDTVVDVLRQLPRSQWEQRYQRFQAQQEEQQQQQQYQHDQQQWRPMGREDGGSLSDGDGAAEGGDGQQPAEFEGQAFEFEGDESEADGVEFAADEFGQPQPFATGGFDGGQMEAEGDDSNEFDPQYYQPQQ